MANENLEQILTEVDYHLASRIGAVKTRMTAAETDIDVLEATYYRVRDYGAVLDGGTDDYGAFITAMDAMSYGDTLIIDGPLKFGTPIVITKAINLVCVGSSAYFLPDLTTAQDGITYSSPAGQQHVDWNINVYGPANCCQNAVVLTTAYRSRFRFDVQCGAAAYGVKILGALICDFNINISDNYDPPYGSSAAAPLDCVHIDKNDGIATNANRFTINLESGRHGIVADAMGGGQGNNTFCGTIEGVTGRPLNLTGCYHFDINNLHLESNGDSPLLTNCHGFTIGPGIRGDENYPLTLVTCDSFVIDGYAGGLDIAADCWFGELGRIWLENSPAQNIVNASSSVRMRGMARHTYSAVMQQRTPGDYALENFFHNPYMDIWSQGAAAAPDGWGGTNATWARNTGTTYPGNPIRGAGAGVSARVRTTATAVANGPVATPLTQFRSMPTERWVSFVLPVLVPTGMNDLRIYLKHGSTFGHLGRIVTEKDTWVETRGSVKVAASATISIWPRFYNTASAMYKTGTCYIGGLSIVNGPIQPQYLADHGRRSEYIVDNVSHTPAFAGQIAIDGTGIHMAKNNSASSDWRPIDHT